MHKEWIKRKRVILYGDERYIRDFLYVFDDIVPAYYVDDRENGFAGNWRKIESEIIEDIIIVLCKYDELQAVNNLNSIGLIRGKNYISAEVCFKWLDFPMEAISEIREVFVWGTGKDSYTFFRDYLMQHGEIHVTGVVDTDSCKVGQLFFGKRVYLPEDVVGSENSFFIIATRKYYGEIREILESVGKKHKRDYISYVGINHYASEMMTRTVYDIPKTSFLCEKPFRAFELKPEGRTLICGGMHETYDKNEPMYYSSFFDVWESSILKVARLSCVNGTYTFCDPVLCCYIRECGACSIDINDLRYKTEKTAEQLRFQESKKRYQQNTVLCSKNYLKHESKYPETVQMGFDESCNLHCPSCRKDIYYAKSEKILELSMFKKRVYDEILENVSRIKIAGMGEAFASAVYKDMLFDSKLAAAIGKIGIITNGSMFIPEKFDQLASLWKNINIFVSMDGASKKTAERLRAGVHFDIWKQNMKYLGEMRQRGKIGKLAFNFVVQRANFQEMSDYVNMCLGFHADNVKFSMLGNWGNWTKEEFDEISMIDENGEMKQELREVVKNDIFNRPEVFLFRWIDW